MEFPGQKLKFIRRRKNRQQGAHRSSVWAAGLVNSIQVQDLNPQPQQQGKGEA